MPGHVHVAKKNKQDGVSHVYGGSQGIGEANIDGLGRGSARDRMDG